MKGKLKTSLQIGIRQLILLFCSVIVGCGLLVMAYLIPQEAIYDNTRESINVLYTEWSRNESCQQWMGIKGTIVDYFTDGLIINTAYIEEGNILENVLLANHIAHEVERSPLTALYSYLFEEDQVYSVASYAVYWHGYQTILRPLLMIMSVSSIRFLNMAVQISLVILLLGMLIRKQKERLAVPFLVMWLSLIPNILFVCFQYSSAFYATIFTSLLVAFLWQKEKDEKLFIKLCLAFESGGIILAYFDILTYPLVALGVPLILFLSMDADCKAGIIERGRQIVALSASWIVGYVGMWFGKWAMATLFTEENILQNAWEKLVFRSSHEYGDAQFSLRGTIAVNLSFMSNGIFVILFAGAVLLFFICCMRYHVRVNIPVLLSIGIVSLYPFVWYFFTMNHSNLHAVYTWRELVISVYGAMSILYVNVTNVPRKECMRKSGRA